MSTLNVDYGKGTDIELESVFQPSIATEYSDWNHWDFSNVEPKVKRVFIVACVLILAFLLIGLPILLDACSEVVPFEYNAVVVDYRGHIERKPVGPGRIFRAAGFRIQKYPRFDVSVEYTHENGNPISTRVQDGQVISLDISWQYSMNKKDLVEVYRIHKAGFEGTLSQVIFSTLRDVAAGYASQTFFENRTTIEAELRSAITEEARVRGATVTGFQVRSVILPAELDNRLIQIQMRNQEARAGTARLELERIRADSAAEILALQTARRKLKTEIEQTTRILVVQVNQQRDAILEQTLQLLTQINEESARNISLFTKETELLLEEFDLNTTVALEETRRLVEEVTVSLATNVSIYKQETENLRLAYDNDIALIEQETRRNVSEIESETTRIEASFIADLAFELSEAHKLSALQEHEATLAVANARNNATERGLQGLAAEAFMAQEAAQALLGHIRYMDVRTPDTLKLDTVL